MKNKKNEILGKHLPPTYPALFFDFFYRIISVEQFMLYKMRTKKYLMHTFWYASILMKMVTSGKIDFFEKLSKFIKNIILVYLEKRPKIQKTRKF